MGVAVGASATEGVKWSKVLESEANAYSIVTPHQSNNESPNKGRDPTTEVLTPDDRVPSHQRESRRPSSCAVTGAPNLQPKIGNKSL